MMSGACRQSGLLRLRSLRFGLFASCALAGMVVSGAQAQVVPSGATATTVTTMPSGLATVQIAPANTSGISHNTYSSFSVGRAGVTLDNRTVFANTIVNQVTSSNRSLIEGPVTVLGTRAHVILANPNGITVDGGSFVNTGGVVLSGGNVTYAPSLTSPGMVNAIVSSGSDIVVTGQGLSGAMPTLQLMAARILIDGAVSNTHPSPNADININAGDAQLTLDSSVVAGTTVRPWATRTQSGTDSSSEILVTVTPNGSLSSSAVQIAVNAKGAGVAFAGRGNAAIGAFNITADGKIALNGAQISGEKGVKLIGRSIDVLNSPDRQSTLTSISGSVTLLANAGDINIQGHISGARQVSNTADPAYDADAKGAITLAATGDINLLSQSAEKLAIVFADKGDLSITAGGNLNNNTGRLLSNENVVIKAGGAVNNTVDIVGRLNFGQPVVTVSRGPRFFFGWFGGRRKRKTTTVTWGDLRIPNQLGYIVGQSVFIDSATVFNQGEIDSQDGPMRITTGVFRNEAVNTGTLSFRTNCSIMFCTAKGDSTINTSGGRINASLSMNITASGSIVNDGGQIVSYGNMAISAPTIVSNATFVPQVVTQPGGFEKWFRGKRSWVVLQPVGGQFIAPVGSITIDTDQPVSLNGGQLLAETGVINPNGVVVVSPARSRLVSPPQHIGVFRGLFE